MRIYYSVMTITILGVCIFALHSMEEESGNKVRPFYEILAEEETDDARRTYNKFEDTTGGKDQFNDEMAKKYGSESLKEYVRLDGLIEKVKNDPVSSIWGGINYGMTLDEMTRVVKEKFAAMKAAGKIVSLNEFENIKDDYYTQKPNTKLSRLWGSLYLKGAINGSDYLRTQYDVPDYVIVAPDLNNIKVKVYFANNIWPLVEDLENATVYFKAIAGRGVGKSAIGNASEIGYSDYSDSGNIIRDDKTGKNFVVDTEFKSFEIPLHRLLEETLKYAGKKFRYLNNGIADYTISIGRLEK